MRSSFVTVKTLGENMTFAKTLGKNKHSERGQAAIMVSLALPLILGLVALVVDVGYGYYLKQVGQAVVDSASIAGAVEAKAQGACTGDNFDHQTIASVAEAYARANGTDRTTVSITTGTVRTAGGVETLFWVQAVSTEAAPIFFGGGYGRLSVSARATAGVVRSALGSCYVALID